MQTPNSSYLNAYLNIYWLRPITAMWRTINCLAMEGIEFPEPSIDLSCGDGLFSFVRAGGRVGLDVDMYTSVAQLDQFFQNVDVYDAMSPEYKPEIVTPAQYQMTVGADWKPNLLAKAATLNFYRELVQHDNNLPLPFEDNQFATVFSNSIYWVENLEGLLSEVSRILRPDGRAILVMLTKDILNYNVDIFKDYLPAEWLSLIDRGRKANYPRIQHDEDWQAMFQAAGLRVVKVIPQISWVHLHMEDIDLRAISPVLIKMANYLSPEQRREVKAEWIEIFERLLEPFSVPNFDFGVQRPSGEVVYVLEAIS